jgi:hypothetical protein
MDYNIIQVKDKYPLELLYTIDENPKTEMEQIRLS